MKPYKSRRFQIDPRKSVKDGRWLSQSNEDKPPVKKEVQKNTFPDLTFPVNQETEDNG